MTGMRAYYISRALLSVGFGVLFVLGGASWWVGILIAAVAFGWFLLAPRIGRYSVHPERGVTALQRDERSQMINDKAARNAFVICMLAVAGVALYHHSLALSSVPTAVLEGILVLGAAVYYISDFLLRRASS